MKGKRYEGRLVRFNIVWDALAGQGVCDSRPGAEHDRVCRQWIAAGCPEQVTRFIRVYANLPVSGHVPHRRGQRRGIYPRRGW